jgi:hypothetical protein
MNALVNASPTTSSQTAINAASHATTTPIAQMWIAIYYSSNATIVKHILQIAAVKNAMKL